MKNQVYIHVSRNEVMNKKAVRKAFDQLHDGKWLMTLENANKRSLNQNAYLHGVIIPMVYDGLRDAGYEDVKTKEDAKLVIKALFLKRQVHNPINDDTIEVVKDTHDLTTEEMNIFIEDVIQWAATYLSIQIPYPNEQMSMQL